MLNSQVGLAMGRVLALPEPAPYPIKQSSTCPTLTASFNTQNPSLTHRQLTPTHTLSTPARCFF